MNYIDLQEAKSIHETGGNVTEFLRAKYGESYNTSEIIEIAYELHAGTYIDRVNSDPQYAWKYAEELGSMILPHIVEGGSLLDVGTGELTMLSLMLNRLPKVPSDVYAFDISWSRLSKGKTFWSETVTNSGMALYPFAADMNTIPLATKSIDVISSHHALEPNGQNLPNLLQELFRVCRHRLVLFEPTYELNTTEGKARMDKLGYIKGIEKVVTSLGGKVLDVSLKPIKNTGHPLNPTACYVVEPPQDNTKNTESGAKKFTVPGTNLKLTRHGQFLASSETGLVFPVLENIPILKEKSAILATSLFSSR